ncbi:hypothetical protein J6524_32005 [Bradyrhizobium sp. WSM 1738]|uniref:hypothetical protein n=1 Tax=Bradyrhizobium hereditatis TaxID=2821405 RepID=UPI001CE2963C|nr:hypothetical protein [Bradyrhizobium hereditatis]MCA6119464.1 hypothetical protein [Bradyrhizobium hereditatis]
MLRMVLVGLLIPLGIGVLAAMELRTPARNSVAVVQPLAETAAGASDSDTALVKSDRLEKADRLEIAAASSETPPQPILVDERVSPSEDVSVGPSEPPRMIIRHRHDPKSKKAAADARPKKVATDARPKKVAAAAAPKSNPRTTEIKRTIISERRKAASDNEPCRLSAFGGLRKALNSLDCEI